MLPTRRKAKSPLPLWTDFYGWAVSHYLHERSDLMSIEFLNTAMVSLFVGVWLLVGHIISVDHF